MSTVADLIYTCNVSLDGFIEDDHGSFDFTEPDEDVFATSSGSAAGWSTSGTASQYAP
jgi:hypothetical protein